MTEFAVDVAGARFATRIVAEDCECVPPPHQHYHLEAGHFRHLPSSRAAPSSRLSPDGVTRSRNG
jgi:hypothetical protein